MSRFGSITINGKAHELDDLTLDEMEEVEELCDGKPFGEMTFGSAKEMKAMAWILLRKDDPSLTFEQIGALKLTGFLQSDADEEMPDLGPPAEGADVPNGSAPDVSGVPASAASIPGLHPGIPGS